MKLTESITTPRARVIVLVSAIALAVAATITAWFGGNALTGLLVLVLSAVVIAIVKVLLELANELGMHRHRADAVHRDTELRVEASLSRLDTIDESLASVDESLGTQADFNEAILSRIRPLERSSQTQREFNETALDRVRSVEQAATQQGEFGEGILKRVRNLEQGTSGQSDFNEAVLQRVRRLETSAGEQSELAAGLANRLNSAEAAGTEALATARALSGRSFHSAQRLISDTELAEIQHAADAVLGYPVSESQLRYIERVTLGMEVTGTGRLAAHSADVALRLVASLSRGTSVVHAEIGVLSGLYAALLGRISGEVGVETFQVLIDPLEGYYGESELDTLTLSNISAANVRRNMALAGCDPDQYSLIQGLSGDEATMRQASTHKYDTILIDGDHSYEGVTLDIELYGPLLAPDGLLLLDDYGNPSWPGVTRAIDDQAAAGRIEILTVISKTAIARYLVG